MKAKRTMVSPADQGIESTRADAALAHLEKAAALFRKMEAEATALRDFGAAGSWAYFRKEVETLIESDHGEAGLKPLIKKMNAGDL